MMMIEYLKTFGFKYHCSMNKFDGSSDESILDNIMNNMNNIHTTSKNRSLYDRGERVLTFPERHHPRRKMMYKTWVCNSNTFFILRSRGVPVLTAYFLCETSNNVHTHRSISSFVSSSKRDDAVNTLKIL
jgi:hypothetical protein